MELSNVKSRAVSDGRWHLVRVAIALLLLVAAATKCHQCCTGPIPGSGIFSARWFVICLVEAEWLGALGLLLLAGVFPKPAWATALACFIAITLVSLGKGLAGEASCGCFGRWELDPFLTAMMDGAIVVLLLRWRPKPTVADFRQASARALGMLVIWLVVGVPAAYAMVSCTGAALSDSGGIIGHEETVALSPEAWVGKSFPLLGHIDGGSLLKNGTWVVLLYHHDCSVCRNVVPEYQALSRKFADRRTGPQVALIECPPYNQYIEPLNGKNAWFDGRLSNRKRWAMKTPVALVMENGTISSMLHDARPDVLEQIWLSGL